MSESWLTQFSQALDRSREAREARRLEINAELEKRVFLFVPDETGAPVGHGVGWIRGDTGGFLAFRRYSNGYEAYPCMQLEDDLVRALAEKI